MEAAQKAFKQDRALERLVYEIMPFFYLAAGIASLVTSPPLSLLYLSGGLLALAALTILRMRHRYRRCHRREEAYVTVTPPAADEEE